MKLNCKLRTHKRLSSFLCAEREYIKAQFLGEFCVHSYLYLAMSNNLFCFDYTFCKLIFFSSFKNAKYFNVEACMFPLFVYNTFYISYTYMYIDMYTAYVRKFNSHRWYV